MDMLKKREPAQHFFRTPLGVFFSILPLFFLISCGTAVQKRTHVLPSVSLKTTQAKTTENASAKRYPSPESYLHAILGLQYEVERRVGSLAKDDRNALKEYLTALRHDPDALFLLKRVATLYSRLGNQKDALYYAEKARRLSSDKNDELLILLGDIYLVSGDREKGLAAYQQSIQVNAKQRDLYFKIAGIHAEQGSLDEAKEAVYLGIEVGPPVALPYYYLGMIALQKREMSKGLDFFREALSLDPYFESAHMGIANIYERQKNLEAALNVYRHVVNRINPRNRQAVNRLLQLLVQKGSLDEAEALLSRLLRQDPSNYELALQRVGLFVEKQNLPSAIDALLPIVAAKPGETRLRVYLASLYEKNGALEAARTTYHDILEQSPSEYEVRLRLGSLYFYRLKNPDAALVQGEMAKKINPQRPEPYLFTGVILNDAERYAEAVKIFSEGIKKNPEMPDLYFHLGAAFDKLGRFDEMVSQMERAIQLAPKHANALNYLGYTFADKGVRLDEAFDLVQRALDERPDDGYFIDSLAWVHYRQGNLEEATTLLEKAVALVPSDPVIYEHLGEIYLKNEQIDLAKAAWERSLALNPENEELVARFIEAGFGQPLIEDSAVRLKSLPLEAH